MFAGIEVIRVPFVARGNGGATRLVLNFLSFVLFASLFGPRCCRGFIEVVFVYESSPVTVGMPGLVMKAVKKASLMFSVQDLWPESLSVTGAVLVIEQVFHSQAFVLGAEVSKLEERVASYFQAWLAISRHDVRTFGGR
jgi:hypothetical protein